MIKDIIKDKSFKEKLDYKKVEIASLTVKKKYQRANLEIEIVDIQPMEDGVEILARAWDANKKQIGFGKDGTVDVERFRIIMTDKGANSDVSWVVVPDENGDIIRESSYYDQDNKLVTISETYREDPQEHTLMKLESIINSIKTFDDTNIIKNKIGNTLTSFPANSGGDGSLTYGDTTYTTARDSAAAEAVRKTQTVNFCMNDKEGSTFNVQRIYEPFDTSSLPDTDTIDSATYTVRQTSAGEGGRQMGLTLSTQADPEDLVVGDFDALTLNSATEGTDTRWDGTVGVGDVTMTLNSTGLGWIDKTGWTKLVFRMDGDLDNSEPSVRNYIQLAHNENVTAAYRPSLNVTHSAAATFTPKVMMY